MRQSEPSGITPGQAWPAHACGRGVPFDYFRQVIACLTAGFAQRSRPCEHGAGQRGASQGHAGEARALEHVGGRQKGLEPHKVSDP